MDKNQWSEEQPPEWQGEPIGSEKPLPHSAEWAPPVAPAASESAPSNAATPPPSNSAESSVGAMLNQSFDVIKKLAKSTLGLAAFFGVLSAFLMTAVGYAFLPSDSFSQQVIRDLLNTDFAAPEPAWMTDPNLNPESFYPAITWAAAIAAVGLVVLLLQVFVSAAIVRQSISYLRQERLSFSEAWRQVPRRNVWNLIFAFIGQISVALVVAIVVTLISSLVAGGEFLILILVFTAIPLGIWYSIAVTIALPVSVDGERSGTKAIFESIRLMRGAWWRTFAVLLLFGLMFGLPLSTLAGIPNSVVSDPILLLLISLFTQTFISAFGVGYQAAVTSAIYRARILAKK